MLKITGEQIAEFFADSVLNIISSLRGAEKSAVYHAHSWEYRSRNGVKTCAECRTMLPIDRDNGKWGL